jgi:hypothetical protein
MAAPDDDDDPPVSEPDEREEYEPPKLEVEQLYETLALTCGKIRPNRFGCFRVAKMS